MTLRRAWMLLLICGIAWALALLHRGAGLGPDEVEFFRATRWTADGFVPFRDFWEHHMPLQWLLFAPVARLIANGPGVESVIAMRWAQGFLWVLVFVLLVRLSRRERISLVSALAFLLISPTFIRRAIEYRVDVAGTLAFVGAIAAIAGGATRRRWLVFGALMSAAVLANMRLAPLVLATAALALVWRGEQRVWRWNPRALWMIPSVVVAVALAFGWLRLTHAWQPFLDGAIGYNVASAKLIDVHTFFDAFLQPLWLLDPAGIAFWVVAAVGLWLASREVRRPGPIQFIGLVAVVSVISVALMEVHYDYHFQLSWLLLLPIVALGLERLSRPVWGWTLLVVAAAGLTVALAQSLPTFGRELNYQDAVMTAADRWTAIDDAVLDGGGYALRRRPAWKYWFLTTGVRLMVADGQIRPYSAVQRGARPPGAIIYDYRLALYMDVDPAVRQYAVSHYVPLYRNLWLPGATLRVAPGISRIRWVAPKAMRYAVWSSEALAGHPWFRDPAGYAAVQGPLAARYAIPLARLRPLAPGSLVWQVDGVRQPDGIRALDLRRGARVELLVQSVRPAGVLLVPEGIDTLAMGPSQRFLF